MIMMRTKDEDMNDYEENDKNVMILYVSKGEKPVNEKSHYH